jgi:23S rRNA (adenine2503-C2)-methyltransferase
MDARIHLKKNEHENNTYFLTPTNHTYDDFAETFGADLADSVFYGLYASKKNRLFYRQIYPLIKNRDSSTTKYAFQLSDGQQIETVCIKRRTGITACLSTQVGCPIRCRFCKSGEKGLIRSLKASEIVQQYLFVDEKINRIVFMGIGEPLCNYDEVIKAIHIIRDRKGINFATDGITVSTVGPIDKMAALRGEHIKIQLMLSLHATDQKTRDYLIPGMKKHRIDDVIGSALVYGQRHNRKIGIAYLLLPGINDRAIDISKLTGWFSKKNVVINLMKYNGSNTKEFKTATKKEITWMREILENHGVEVTFRESVGTSIKAACGQLTVRG